jgi:hypothetical protein
MEPFERRRRVGRPPDTIWGTITAVDHRDHVVLAWSDGEFAGNPALADRAAALANGEAQLPLSPTGPFVGPDALPPLRAIAAMCMALGDGVIQVEGDVPEAAVAALLDVPDEAVA